MMGLLIVAGLAALLMFDRNIVRGRSTPARDSEPPVPSAMTEPPRAHWSDSVWFHIVGIALVLNSIITYASFGFFKLCSSPSEATCFNSRGQTEYFLSSLVTIGHINLALRFMAGGGFLLDVLAIIYVIRIIRREFTK